MSQEYLHAHHPVPLCNHQWFLQILNKEIWLDIKQRLKVNVFLINLYQVKYILIVLIFCKIYLFLFTYKKFTINWNNFFLFEKVINFKLFYGSNLIMLFFYFECSVWRLNLLLYLQVVTIFFDILLCDSLK
jgi:hypothetical protein